MKHKRSSGVLIHPTSFPSSHGIGDFGKSAYEFIDFLVEGKQKYWQVLPLGPTGYGDSPYQCFSAFAGNLLLISPDKLAEDGLLNQEELRPATAFDSIKINYGEVIPYKTGLFKKAHTRFVEGLNGVIRSKYETFCTQNKAWLNNYSLFMALKDYHNGVPWYQWDASIAQRDSAAIAYFEHELADQIEYYKFLQYQFFKQWLTLKAYANQNYIRIIGDAPIFVAHDSADVWTNPELFYLDDKGLPTIVAGVPPDYFSATGQLWGNPLYRWSIHKKSGYKWWIQRMESLLTQVDIIRLDHFRGFEGYWAVPYGEETAINGTWKKGPGREFFEALNQALGSLPIVAEDLGIITPEVEALRDDFELPGIKVLQFAFDMSSANGYLPHNYTQNAMVYTGTHDNDTMSGWFSTLPDEVKDYASQYLNGLSDNISWDFIRLAFSSVANIVIIPLQDIMALGSEARMNTPGTSNGNWQWRYSTPDLKKNLAGELAALTALYGRG